MVAKFAREHFPSHEYTSFAFMTNVKTLPHRDSHNCPYSLNLVVALSEFTGGAIWAADVQGDIFENMQGVRIAGRDHARQSGAVWLPPREWHFTRSWKGQRVVLVLYCVRDYLKASPDDLKFLAGLGYRFPAGVYKRFRSLRPPTSLCSEDRDEMLVARDECELEQWCEDKSDGDDGPVLDLPPDVICDLLEFDPEQFIAPKRCRRNLQDMLCRPGFLDCYSGSRGVASELAELSGSWVLTFDFRENSYS